ncbi:hypothetical protein PPYR_11114 [Photinus pyralis]|uniref:HORMA domain-containing protein n=1 Tax=Photinus pyralis TaxID=7054 RepID=A0A1Y1M292_PHOPY|nr:HORMA domain-containing protein 2-like [Photinus pyralis]KAB0797053.1 hypothetical protein PPYR_11114 [Photinus pyralis]
MSVTGQVGCAAIPKPSVHTAVLNPQGSAALLRKVLSCSLASILYTRTNINRGDFIHSSVNGQPLQGFNRKTETPAITQIVTWLKGSYDALDKHYLREMYLFLNNKQTGDIMENYKFVIHYFDSNELHHRNKSDFGQSLTELFKTIQNLFIEDNILEGNDLNFYMCVSYYDNVTPSNYCPVNFIEPEEDVNHIIESIRFPSPYETVIRTVSTGFHRVEFATNQYTAINESATMLQGLDVETEQALLEKLNCTCCIPKLLSSIPFLTCSKCQSIAHAPCIGRVYHVENSYTCASCKEQNDISRSTPGDLWRIQNLCTYRLILFYAYSKNKFPNDLLNEIDPNIKDYIVKKLIAVAAIRETTKGYLINQACLEQIIRRWANSDEE